MLKKFDPSVGADLLLPPKILEPPEPPELVVDPKILGDCAIEVVAGASLGLLAPRSNPPKLLDGAAADVLSGAED